MSATSPYAIEEFRQRYAWTAVQLQATNSIIEPVLTMFRLRSIRPEYINLYEPADNNIESNGVTQDMIEKAAKIMVDQESNQVVFKAYPEKTKDQLQDLGSVF
jgi:hypothetical protein